MDASSTDYYKIKHIQWPPGSPSPHKTPVLLQDLNGPCPLIAIANVLLLKGALTLPAAAGEISQGRLVELVAGHLLDSVSRAPSGNDEYRANLQHNLSDAISLLPKLTTGVDVNVRFDHARSLEFTGETAVFDLLGIDLVHGWLVDPQDAATAAAVGARSYNELVMEVVTALGGAASPPAPSPAASRRASQPAAAAAAAAAEAAGSGAAAAPVVGDPPQQAAAPPAKPIDAAALSAALQTTLRISIPEGPGPARSLSSNDSRLSQDSVRSELNRMMGDTVKNAFNTPSSTPGSAAAQLQPLPLPEPRPAEASWAALPADETAAAAEAEAAAPAGAAPEQASEAPAPLFIELQTHAEPPAPSPDGPAAPLAPDAAASAPAPPPPAAAAAPPAPALLERAPSSPGERASRQALLVREFLDQTPSQLTVHGLASLQEGLGDGQLAVFFRNNHFNALLKQGGSLYILVTDQGYLFEPEIVWERLDAVDGDTELLDWDLKPFAPHAAPAPAPRAAAGGGGGGGAAAAAAAAAAAREWEAATAAGGGSADADFALAMQLQEEEEERVRLEEQRRRESQARAAQAARAREQAAQQAHGAGDPSAAQGQPAPSGSRPAKKPKDKGTDCCVM